MIMKSINRLKNIINESVKKAINETYDNNTSLSIAYTIADKIDNLCVDWEDEDIAPNVEQLRNIFSMVCDLIRELEQ